DQKSIEKAQRKTKICSSGTRYFRAHAIPENQGFEPQLARAMVYMKHIKIWVLLIVAAALLQGCGISYSFTGGSIHPDMKTVTVYFFENTAQIGNPTLSQSFTEALKERIRNQSSLSQVDDGGDALFEGRITAYTINPAAVEAG